ncbi:hypothetical protein [Flavobacterium muglaense]|nr:hypothetical protein [Flavobacterium muglaense]
MASISETGHNKNVTTFETLILTCTGFGDPASAIVSFVPTK